MFHRRGSTFLYASSHYQLEVGQSCQGYHRTSYRYARDHNRTHEKHRVTDCGKASSLIGLHTFGSSAVVGQSDVGQRRHSH